MLTHLHSNPPACADITICIPSFNTGSRLEVTVGSALQQNFSNFRIRIAIEPTEQAEHTICIAQKLADADKRIEVVVNPRILGWAENIRQLQLAVQTPYFLVLPHDDALHPECLSQLHCAIQKHPEAAIVFPHIYFLGAADGLQAQESRTEDLAQRLIRHFADGGAPEFWKGLTRTSILTDNGGFPAYGKKSFAAEYEWAAMLLQSGEAHVVPEAIYYKRIHKETESSVSNEWMFKDADDSKLDQLAEHHVRMTDRIQSLPLNAAEIQTVLEAWQAAYFWRILEFRLDLYPLPHPFREIIHASTVSNPLVRNRLRLCELRSRIIEKDFHQVEVELLQIVDEDPLSHDAQMLLMKARLRLGENDAAVRQMNLLEKLFPNSWRHREVQQWLAKQLAHQYGQPVG